MSKIDVNLKQCPVHSFCNSWPAGRKPNKACGPWTTSLTCLLYIISQLLLYIIMWYLKCNLHGIVFIGIISTFLHVHPFGASIEYICSYLHRLDNKVCGSLELGCRVLCKEVNLLSSSIDKSLVIVLRKCPSPILSL